MRLENFYTGIYSEPQKLPRGVTTAADMANLRTDKNGFLRPRIKAFPVEWALGHAVEGVVSTGSLVFYSTTGVGALYVSVDGETPVVVPGITGLSGRLSIVDNYPESFIILTSEGADPGYWVDISDLDNITGHRLSFDAPDFDPNVRADYHNLPVQLIKYIGEAVGEAKFGFTFNFAGDDGGGFFFSGENPFPVQGIAPTVLDNENRPAYRKYHYYKFVYGNGELLLGEAESPATEAYLGAPIEPLVKVDAVVASVDDGTGGNTAPSVVFNSSDVNFPIFAGDIIHDSDEENFTKRGYVLRVQREAATQRVFYQERLAITLSTDFNDGIYSGLDGPFSDGDKVRIRSQRAARLISIDEPDNQPDVSYLLIYRSKDIDAYRQVAGEARIDTTAGALKPGPAGALISDSELEQEFDKLTDNDFHLIALLPRLNGNFPSVYRDNVNPLEWAGGAKLPNQRRRGEFPTTAKSIHYYNGTIFAVCGNELRFCDVDFTGPRQWSWPESYSYKQNRVDYAVEYAGMLLFGNRDSTWQLTGLAREDYAVRHVSGRGALNSHCAHVLTSGLAVMSENGMYVGDGTSFQKISGALDQYFKNDNILDGMVIQLPNDDLVWAVEQVGESRQFLMNLDSSGSYWEAWEDFEIKQSARALAGFVGVEAADGGWADARGASWGFYDPDVTRTQVLLAFGNDRLQQLAWSDAEGGVDTRLRWYWQSHDLYQRNQTLAMDQKIWRLLNVSGFSDNPVDFVFRIFTDGDDLVIRQTGVTLQKGRATQVPIRAHGQGLSFLVSGVGDVTIRGFYVDFGIGRAWR